MQHQWLKWFQGYLIVILKGKRIERLINLSTQRRMQVWNISRFDNQRGRIAIRLADYYQLRPLLKETGCRARIISKHGLPFYFRKAKKRYAFFIGFVGFLVMLFLLSNVIWSIEIEGAENINHVEVLTEAKKLGVEQGKFSFLLDDPNQIQAQLMSRIPEASWIGFKMDGTKAKIRIVEKVMPEVKEDVYARHLVASKSAVVSNIFAERGKPLVSEDDFVRKGDILVSGLIGKEEEPVAVMAQGKIEGEVWYETDVVIPIRRKHAAYTGENHRNFYFMAGDMKLKLWGFKEVPFAQYEVKENPRVWQWKESKLKVGWQTEQLLAVEHTESKVTVDEALQLAKEAAKQDVISKMKQGGYIKEEKVLLQREENDKVYIKFHVVAIEDIAVEQPIFLEGE
ncbi:sporulation protein YqfD [Ammoniphilus oxalaticus]|uniref:Sporulation protein YqfD n=1 Tax=Ammoniphilus oxalaticus TaxID=66863 RepID=A0A419SIZ7_9BACL|nr:sporulation protein YqfD [Ammoniphilus oxalaticus]RKD24004.1 sporulation protein YqfD [Ammoniphilus oxalaticus]